MIQALEILLHFHSFSLLHLKVLFLLQNLGLRNQELDFDEGHLYPCIASVLQHLTFVDDAYFANGTLAALKRDYGILVLMFFIANLCNNYAFNFNIPMPLHMIFRAGSLIANMIMGVVILRKKYAFSKYLSVFMISAGIVICTFVSGQDVVRIILLTVALFVSARMGIYQEVLYAKYGKHPREALFYTHLLPLPGFLIWYQSIVEHAGFLAQSEPFAIPILGFGLPKIYICINSVYVLTTECSSLTVTLVVTLRKFVSLLFSIIYFKNDFTLLHWTGTLLVFVGTLIFTEIVSKIINSIRETSKVKTN
uniref:UDP-xylose and UDP-N-acetylglucosamine transporter n=1 Tax=Timema shepardi TaxID=629360 RepID=A0A7R9AZT4_TIMSH|nr:unnamed protein product [Timema shepardi]